MAEKKNKLGRAALARVFRKKADLIKSGEAESEDQAEAIAFSLERQGKLKTALSK